MTILDGNITLLEDLRNDALQSSAVVHPLVIDLTLQLRFMLLVSSLARVAVHLDDVVAIRSLNWGSGVLVSLQLESGLLKGAIQLRISVVEWI